MTRSDAFVKRRTEDSADFFSAEAAGLRWLAEPAGIGGARVVQVLDVGNDHIELQRLIEVPATRRAAEQFGRALAVTHAAGAAAFGVGPDGGPGRAWIGRQQLELGRHQQWGTFYAELRLLPFARAAFDRGRLDADALSSIDLVCERLRSGEFDDNRPPARIHGDLWTGNVLWTPAGATLIDPAAHGGHGETDLAMLALFGLPHLEVVERAYAEAAGSAADWRERTALHQLHPLLVHAVSHGPSYARVAEAVASRYR